MLMSHDVSHWKHHSIQEKSHFSNDVFGVYTGKSHFMSNGVFEVCQWLRASCRAIEEKSNASLTP